MTFSLPLTPYVSFSIPSNPATPIHPAPYNFFDYLTFPPVLSSCTTFLQKPSGHKNPSPGWASCSCFAPTASSVYLCPERAPLLWILFVHLSLPLDWESSLRVRQHRIHLSSPRACSVLMYKILSMQISASVLSLVKATSNLFGNLSYTNCLCLSRFSCVWLLVTLWTVAHQAPLSKGFTKDLPLEWIAISSSRGFSWPRDRIHISYVSCIGRWVPYHWFHLIASKSFLLILNLFVVLFCFCWEAFYSFSRVSKLGDWNNKNLLSHGSVRLEVWDEAVTRVGLRLPSWAHRWPCSPCVFTQPSFHVHLCIHCLFL